MCLQSKTLTFPRKILRFYLNLCHDREEKKIRCHVNFKIINIREGGNLSWFDSVFWLMEPFLKHQNRLLWYKGKTVTMDFVKIELWLELGLQLKILLDSIFVQFRIIIRWLISFVTQFKVKLERFWNCGLVVYVMQVQVWLATLPCSITLSSLYFTNKAFSPQIITPQFPSSWVHLNHIYTPSVRDNRYFLVLNFFNPLVL